MRTEIYFRPMGDRKKGQEIQKIQTPTPWGRVLEVLRVDKKDFSINQFERQKEFKRAEYRRMLFGSDGPSFSKMDRALRAMGCTWHDWAQVYEKMGFPPFAKVPTQKEPAVRAKSPPRQKTVGSL